MRVNKEIRALRVRVIDKDGGQVGILPTAQALIQAEEDGLDLVEIAPNADPPVCKIIDYGKFRYQQTKKEKESKKAQHQIKVKEVKLKPNTDDHDLQTKIKHAREFVTKGNKVRVICTFRGREMQHPEFGMKVIQRFCEALADLAFVEESPRLLGRAMSAVLAPGGTKLKKKVVGPVPTTQATSGQRATDAAVSNEKGEIS